MKKLNEESYATGEVTGNEKVDDLVGYIYFLIEDLWQKLLEMGFSSVRILRGYGDEKIVEVTDEDLRGLDA